MKRILLIAGLLTSMVTASAQVQGVSIRIDGGGNMGRTVAQKELDKAYLECIYEHKYLKDTLGTVEAEEDLMILHIGPAVSKFFSDKTQKADAALRTEIAPGLSVQLDDKFQPGETYQIFKERENGKLIFTDRLMTENFRYEEPLGEQQWEIMDETREILGYECQMAVCNFRGRHYTAWFTSDIPVSDGPWKFNGLPGLIMAVADDAGHYSFEMTGIARVDDVPINYPDIIYHKAKRKDYLKTLYKSLRDPIGYLQNNAGMQIKVISADGGSMGDTARDLKYDFMERDYR